MTAYAYNPKSKNNRWPFPVVHVFEGCQTRSNCGSVARDNERLVFAEHPFAKLLTVCERCVHGRENLRDKLCGES